MKKSLIIFGNYGGQNWGDELILSGLLSQISRDKFSLSIVSTNPVSTRKQHHISAFYPPPFGFRSFFRGSFLHTMRMISSADFIFFGGGGLIQDREKKAPFLWAWYALLVRLWRKKVFIVGNSVGPLTSSLTQKMARFFFQKAIFLSVRDPDSEKLLLKLGISQEKIVRASDALFLLPARKKKERKGTLLVLRGDGKISRKRIQKMFKNFPHPIKTLAFDAIDQNFMNTFSDQEMMIPKNLSELHSAVASAELVVSSRLHGGILALFHKTPFLLFSAAPKISHFFSDLGLQESLFPEEKYNIKKIQKYLEKIKRGAMTPLFLRARKKAKKDAKNILPAFFQKR